MAAPVPTSFLGIYRRTQSCGHWPGPLYINRKLQTGTSREANAIHRAIESSFHRGSYSPNSCKCLLTALTVVRHGASMKVITPKMISRDMFKSWLPASSKAFLPFACWSKLAWYNDKRSSKEPCSLSSTAGACLYWSPEENRDGLPPTLTLERPKVEPNQ